MLINTYKAVNSPTVNSIITIHEWFNLIRSSVYSGLIMQARNGLVDYYETKTENLPCCTYNFLFDKYKTNNNILNGTGLLYIDIDVKDFDISVLDLNKIYAYYKSFGGKGYSILVQVAGLTLNNYSDTYNSICKELNLDCTDKGAKKATQVNVLSYDPNIYINLYSHLFFSSEPVVVSGKSTPCVVNKKENNIYDTEGAFSANKMRYDNTDTIEIEGDYIVNWDGYTIIKAWIPIYKIPDGKRYNFFLGYANNLLSLNPHLTCVGLLNNLKHVNPVACVNPIAESQLIKIANSIIKQNDAGNLIPIEFNKKRKIVFSENCNLDKETKLAICRSEVAAHRVEESRMKIKAIIELWDFDKFGKITQPAIVQHHSISRKTVQKYWSEFKELVSVQNAQFNQNKSTEDVISKNNVNGAIEQSISLVANVMPVVENRSDYNTASDVYELVLKTETYFFCHYSIILDDYPDDDDQIIFMNKLMEQPSGNDQVILFNGKSYKFDKATLGNDTLIDLAA